MHQSLNISVNEKQNKSLRHEKVNESTFAGTINLQRSELEPQEFDADATMKNHSTVSHHAGYKEKALNWIGE